MAAELDSVVDEGYSPQKIFERIAIIFDDVFSSLVNEYAPGRDLLNGRRMFLRGAYDAMHNRKSEFNADANYANDILALKLHDAYVASYEYGHELGNYLNNTKGLITREDSSGIAVSRRKLALSAADLFLAYGEILGVKYETEHTDKKQNNPLTMGGRNLGHVVDSEAARHKKKKK